jgi:uncharacterized protein YkuJ
MRKLMKIMYKIKFIEKSNKFDDIKLMSIVIYTLD